MARHAAPAYSLAEEIAHGITHGVGLALSLAGLAALVVAASLRGDAWHVVGCSVFGATLVLLYAASTLYHSLPRGRAKEVFRRLDHAAIFLLIAGTYTPFALVSLRGALGWALLATVWSLAALGIVLVTTIPHRVRHVSLALQLVMGWLAALALEPLARAVHADGLELLVAGGLAYSIGVVFYAWRRLPYHHAVWHLFVLAGSACHLVCVQRYVLPAAG
jgi:hemolysin III